MISNMHKLTISIFAISLITNCSEVKSAKTEVNKEIDTNINAEKKELKNTTSTNNKSKQTINATISKEKNDLTTTKDSNKSERIINETTSHENRNLTNTKEKSTKQKDDLNTYTEKKETQDNKSNQVASNIEKNISNIELNDNKVKQKKNIDERELKKIKDKYNEIKQKINSIISAEAKELKNKEISPTSNESRSSELNKENVKESKNDTEKKETKDNKSNQAISNVAKNISNIELNNNKVKQNISEGKKNTKLKSDLSVFNKEKDLVKTEIRDNELKYDSNISKKKESKNNEEKGNILKNKEDSIKIKSKSNKVKQEASTNHNDSKKSEKGENEKKQKVDVNVSSSEKKNKLTNEKLKKVIKKLIPIVEEGAKKIKIPGGYLVIARKNEIYKVPFGNIALNNSQTVSNNTLFSIASVSKSITAYLVGALVEAGKLKWNDKVRKYDKDFFFHSEELSAELTIQDLISHCSGFKHFSADSLWMGGYPRIKIVDSFKYFKQKPGVFRKYYGYQNIVFGLIGSVLEKATGEKYEDLVKKYIFDKMDMKDSSAIDLKYESSRIEHIKYLISRFKYDISKNGFFSTLFNLIKDPFTFKPKKISDHHSRYNGNIYSVEPNGYLHVFPATSGLAFSANDFAKFIQMILNEGTYNNNTIVSKETFNKITSKITEINKIRDTDAQFKIERFPREDMGYGIGTFITKYGDNGKNTRKVLFHMGGSCGATAFYMISPEDDIGVACVVNLGGTSHTLFTEYICNYFLDLCFDFKEIDWIQEEIDRQKEIEKKKRSFENNIKQFLAPMRNINSYIGKYISNIYGDIEFSVNKNNKLVISNGIKSTELEHVNGDVFKFPSKNMLISYFDSDEYIAFKHNNYNNIDSFYITCFAEGDTVFKRKEEDKSDASKK